MTLSNDAQERVRHFETDQLYRTIRTLLRCATVAFAVYVGFDALTKLAGQDTKLSIALSLAISAFAELKFALAVTLAGGTAAWAVAERSLRHRKVNYLQDRIKKLESQADPNRTSSGLTTAGKTNPEDRIK